MKSHKRSRGATVPAVTSIMAICACALAGCAASSAHLTTGSLTTASSATSDTTGHADSLPQLPSLPHGAASLPWTIVRQSGNAVTIETTRGDCTGRALGYVLTTTSHSEVLSIAAPLVPAAHGGFCDATRLSEDFSLSLPASVTSTDLGHGKVQNWDYIG